MTKIIILIFCLALAFQLSLASTSSIGEAQALEKFNYFNRYSYSTATCTPGTELSISSTFLGTCKTSDL